jgi:hypothetical protein
MPQIKKPITIILSWKDYDDSFEEHNSERHHNSTNNWSGAIARLEELLINNVHLIFIFWVAFHYRMGHSKCECMEYSASVKIWHSCLIQEYGYNKVHLHKCQSLHLRLMYHMHHVLLGEFNYQTQLIKTSTHDKWFTQYHKRDLSHWFLCSLRTIRTHNH